MADLYTKIVLTVIAAALSVNVLISLEFVGPAHAASGIMKVEICDKYGDCANVSSNALRVTN